MFINFYFYIKMKNNILTYQIKISYNNNHIKYSELQPSYKKYHQITIST